jgi:hypothetical protein
MLRELSQLYARRARELSESVARLGQHHNICPELLELMKEIRQRRSLCDEIAEKLDGYVEHRLGEQEQYLCAPGDPRSSHSAAAVRRPTPDTTERS